MVRGLFFLLIFVNVWCVVLLLFIICKCLMIGILFLGIGGRFSFFFFVKNIIDVVSVSIIIVMGISFLLNFIFLFLLKF